MSQKILRIDSSGRYRNSCSRKKADQIIKYMSAKGGDVKVTVRDVAQGLPFVDRKWIEAKGLNEEDYGPDHKKALEVSNALIKELRDNDCYIISCPIYNFSIPASLKAWIDLIALPKHTFNYTDEGFEGLLEDKRAIIIFSSDGTEIGSDYDYASEYLVHFFDFIGVGNVTLVGGKEDMEREQLISALKA